MIKVKIKINDKSDINPPKINEITKKDRKVEGALTFRDVEKEDAKKIKKKIDEIAERNNIRIDMYQKKTPWAKGDKNEK